MSDLDMQAAGLPPDVPRSPQTVSPRAMSGQNIVCFAKDWDEPPTSNHHIMRLLSSGNRVLWLNSIATRTPDFRDGRDLTKIVRKLVAFFRGPKRVANDLWVYTPLVLPFPHHRIAMRINIWILRATLAIVRRFLHMREFQLWVFLPTAARYVGHLRESLVVYYVTDEYSQFTHVDHAEVVKDDRDLCEKADVVFASAQALALKRRALNPRTHLSRHGVDHVMFSAALAPETRVPVDVAALPGPVLGFFGTLQDWIDYDLIEYLAQRHPEWSIALIGEPRVDLSRLRRFRNIHLLGRKPHADLPGYCKGLAVGLIPHKVCPLTAHMNPIKLREYLSAGLPVVSVRLPELEPYADHCRIAETYADFERCVEEAIRRDSPHARRDRSDAMRSETWDRRVQEIASRVMRAQQSQRPRTA